MAQQLLDHDLHSPELLLLRRPSSEQEVLEVPEHMFSESDQRVHNHVLLPCVGLELMESHGVQQVVELRKLVRTEPSAYSVDDRFAEHRVSVDLGEAREHSSD